MRLAAAVTAEYPDVRVEIDLESVEGEDAFLWIRVPRGARPVGLAELVGELTRRHNAAGGYWIVPRIVSGEFDDGPVLRLRPKLFEEPRPTVF